MLNNMKLLFFAITGIFMYSIKEMFGNWLYHFRPKSKLRWIWWSMCEQVNNVCCFCKRKELKGGDNYDTK